MKSLNKYSSYHFIIKVLKEERACFVSLHFITAVSVFLNIIVSTFFMQRLFAAVVAKEFDARFYIHLICFGAFIVLSVVLSIVNKRLNFRLNKRIAYSLDDAVLSHYGWDSLGKRADDLEKRFSIFKQNSSSVQTGYVSFLLMATQTVVTIILIVVYGAVICPSLTALCLAAAGLLVLIYQKRMNDMKEQQDSLIDAVNQHYSLSWELVANLEASVFLSKEKVFKNYDSASDEKVQKMVALRKSYNKFQIFAQSGYMLLLLLTVTVGGLFVYNGLIQLDGLFAMALLLPNIASPLFRLPMFLANLKIIEATFNTYETLLPKEGHLVVEEFDENLELAPINIDNLSYHVDDGSAVLSDISFRVEPGEWLCIVGPSGCGKSTLVKLLLGILPYHGTISYGRHELKRLPQEKLWKNCCYLPQVPILFENTVGYNISLCEEWDAAQMHSVIEHVELTERLANPGERLTASSLSSGEKQKIALARAFASDRQILVMDEPTSALSPATEAALIRKLRQQLSQKTTTVISVTHRTEQMKAADSLLLLGNDGRIRAEGSYQELLADEVFREFLRGEEIE